MDPKKQKSISKLMSLALRHQPDVLQLEIDSAGWTSVNSLLVGIKGQGHAVDMNDLLSVVRENDKQRFQLDESGKRIRASQGHSIKVDLGYEASTPPERLFHGTAVRFISSIRSAGLMRQKRHHVHLHEDRELAKSVGGRHGKPVILEVAADKMACAGHDFFVTPNNVWLTLHVPCNFISFED